jgi:hypothetical protein
LRDRMWLERRCRRDEGTKGEAGADDGSA